jgi:hypothetical protein
LETGRRLQTLQTPREQLSSKPATRLRTPLPRILSIIPFGQTQEIKSVLLCLWKKKPKEKEVKHVKISVVEGAENLPTPLPMLATFRAEDRNEWTFAVGPLQMGTAAPKQWTNG